jgi:ATP-binding cassette, subfamily B, multidrug efflux pump
MKRHSLIRLLKMTVPHIKAIIICILCVLAVNGAMIAKPYILKIVIDDFLIGDKAQRGLYTITSMGIIYMLMVFGSSLLTVIQVNITNRVGQDIIYDIRRRIFTHIQRMPLSVIDKFSSGRLITRSTNDIEALNELFTDVLVNLFKDLFLLIGIVFIMLRMNPKLALISFIVIPFIVMVTNYFKGKIKKNFVEMKALIGRINGFFAENISGMRIVQIFNRQREKREEFEELNAEYYKTTIFQIIMNSILRPIIEIFNALGIAILVYYGMGRIINNTLEIGVLYAFTNYIKQFFEPINELAEKYNTIQSAVVSADRIFELLDQEEKLEDLDKGLNIERFQGEIEFKNVWFAYNDEEWVLKDISFKINKGQTAAFVGATGSGKTTIINLLSRFYEIQEGAILIDGINIKDICLRDLRRNIAVVLQDVFLFSGNIKDNITLNSDIEENDINRALELSNSQEFIDELPNKMEEVVRERGATFSSGQRQLLAFARAIAHDPAIFVLDEATANIDTKTEQLIQRSVENISKDRTTLIIAHRLSTIREADKIIVLNKGKIVEIGNHDNLMERQGYYSQLYQAQYANEAS